MSSITFSGHSPKKAISKSSPQLDTAFHTPLEQPTNRASPGTTKLNSREPSSEPVDDETGKNESILQKIQDTELLPDFMDLIQELRKGELSPKDFNNAAGLIRVKIARLKQYLTEIEGLDESRQQRENIIRESMERIENKKLIISRFIERVGQRIPIEGHGTTDTITDSVASTFTDPVFSSKDPDTSTAVIYDLDRDVVM